METEHVCLTTHQYDCLFFLRNLEFLHRFLLIKAHVLAFWGGHDSPDSTMA
jgi:hypothetical protein